MLRLRWNLLFDIAVTVLLLACAACFHSSSGDPDQAESIVGIATQSAISTTPRKVDLFCKGVEEGDLADTIALDFGKILVVSSDSYFLDIDNCILTLSSDPGDYSYQFTRVYQSSADLENLAIFGMPEYRLKKKKECVLENGVSTVFKVVDGEDGMRLKKYCLPTENTYGDFVYYVLERSVGQKDFECMVCVESEGV